MLTIFLLVFMILFTPIPWIVAGIHIMVKNKKWNNRVSRSTLIIFAFITWIVVGYFILKNANLLFNSHFESVIAQVTAIIIFFIAITLEVATRQVLGTSRIMGSSEIKQTKDRLVTTGIYNYARHPRYVEHPLWALSLGLFFGYYTLIAFAVYLFVSFAILAHFEEQELIERYGEEYRKYKQRTPAFFI